MLSKNNLRQVLSYLIIFLFVSASITGSPLSIFGQDFPLSAKEKRHQPKLVVQTGHRKMFIRSVKFSQNGKIMASLPFGSNVVILWDVATGKQLRVLEKNSTIITSIAFNPNGKSLATLSSTQGIEFWEINTGKISKVIKGRYKAFAFNPDGKTIGVITLTGKIKILSIENGSELKSLEPKIISNKATKSNIKLNSKLAFNPDGKLLAVKKGKNFDILDVESSNKIATFQGLLTAFSPNGKLLAIKDSSKIRIWNIKSKQEVKTIIDSRISWSITFSKDSKTLAGGFFGDSITFWDITSGKKLKTLSKNSNDSIFLEFSPDGKTLAGGKKDGTIKLWDVETNKEIQSFIGTRSELTSSIKISPNKTHIAGFTSEEVYLWNLKKGKTQATLPSRFVSTFSPNGKLIATTIDKLENEKIYFGLRLFDIEKRLEKWRSNTFFEKKPTLVKFSPNGNLLAFSFFGGPNSKKPNKGLHKTVKILDAKTGKEIWSIANLQGEVGDIKFSPDERLLAIIFNYSEKFHPIKIFDLENRKEAMTLVGHKKGIWSIAFSPNSKLLASSSRDNSVKLWNLKSGLNISSIKTTIVDLIFSPSGKKLAGMSAARRGFNFKPFKKVWNVETLSELSIDDHWKGWTDSLDYIVKIGKKRYRIDYKIPFTSKINLVDTESNKTAMSLISIYENDWAIVTPDGLFDASEGAMKLMHFVISDHKLGYEIIDFEQLKSRYYVPGLYQKVTNGEDLGKRGEFTVTLNPKVEVEQNASDSTKLNLKLTNRGGGIGRIEIRVNGGEILGDARGTNFNPNAAEAKLSINIPQEKLKAGTNKVEIIAWNKEGDVRSRGVEVFSTKKANIEKTPPNFYAIIGGVSDYAGNGMNLRYAAKDAEDMAVSLAVGAKGLFCKKEIKENLPCKKVHLTLLSSNNSNTENPVFQQLPNFKRLSPSKSNFKSAFENVGKSAKSKDIFVTYLAGHGTAIKSNVALQKSAFADMYLYATSDATTLDEQRLGNPSERASMISSLELADWFNQSKAEKEILILDTCAAGAVQKDLSAQLSRNSDGEQIKALDRLRERTGFYVLMGSAANAVSYEANRFRQGLLTYSLLEAMSGAKLRDEKFLDIEDWFGYAEDRVEELAKDIGGIQKPRYFKSNFSKRFDVGQIELSERKLIPLTQPVPIILQPRFLNKENLFDSLNLSDLLAQKLRELSYRIGRNNNKSNINYISASKLSGGFTPSGLYTISGNTVTVELTIRKNNQEIDRIKFESSKSDLIDNLTEKIISKTQSKINSN